MKSKIAITVLSLLILGYVSFRVLIYFFDGIDYKILSSKRSPDANYLITEFQSMSEGSHAPYGKHLVLSWGPVNKPDKGHVIFAGYCNTLTYSWASEKEITVECNSTEKDNIKSISTAAYGIEINYQ